MVVIIIIIVVMASFHFCVHFYARCENAALAWLMTFISFDIPKYILFELWLSASRFSPIFAPAHNTNVILYELK